MSYVVINPGSGPVPGRPTLKQAWKNIRAFRRELGVDRVKILRPLGKEDGDGRYGFDLVRGRRKAEMLMPGIPARRIRDEWVRLYIDGNSWYWRPFALNIARDILDPPPPCKHDGERYVAALRVYGGALHLVVCKACGETQEPESRIVEERQHE